MLKAYKSEKRKEENKLENQKKERDERRRIKKDYRKKLQGIADAHTYTIEFSIS